MHPVSAPIHSLQYRLCHFMMRGWFLRALYILPITLMAISMASRMATAQSSIDIEISGAATSTGSTITVADDDTIDWIMSYRNISGSVLHDVSIRNVLSGNQNLVVGSAQFPPGWTFDEVTKIFSAPVLCPNNTATCGGEAVQPTGLFIGTAGTGGDGWSPVIHPSNGRIYNTYHHTNPGIIQCIDTLAGSVCPGYPIILQSGSTSDSFPEETDTAEELSYVQFVGDGYFYPVYRVNSYSESEWGLGCFDVNSANPAQPGPCDGQNGRSQVGVNGFVRMGPQSPSANTSTS